MATVASTATPADARCALSEREPSAATVRLAEAENLLRDIRAGYLSQHTDGKIDAYFTGRPDRRSVVICASEMEFGGWEVDVAVCGRGVGGGTAATAGGALDVAMDVLYGDTNDALNDGGGALRELEALDA